MANIRIGLELMSCLDLGERISLAQEAEARGFCDAFVAEISDPDAFVSCAVVGRSTKRIRVGTCVVQLGVRSVPIIASGAASVAQLVPGRFALGVGVSSEAIVRGWHGMTWAASPVARARESVQLLRAILAGERTDFSGDEVRTRGYQLTFPPHPAPPVHLAALNKQMLRLAGECADGVWLNNVPVNGIARAVEEITKGAAAQGRTPEVLLSLSCRITDEVARTIAELREDLLFYLASPAYRAAFAWHGFQQEMADAARALAARDKDALRRSATDELVRSTALIGSAGAIREQLDQLAAAGLTSPCLCPIDRSDIPEILRSLAPASA